MITLSYRFLQISPKIRALQINLRAVARSIRVLCNKADSVPRRESIRELYNYLYVWALKTAQCCDFMTAKKLHTTLNSNCFFYFDSVLIFLNKITQYLINITSKIPLHKNTSLFF